MKILLINPTRCDSGGRPIKFRKAFIPPLSLAIFAALTPSCHEVVIVNDIVEEIDFDAHWDLVGITVMTIQAARAYQIADRFRAKGTKVIMGGMHPTAQPDESGKHADAVVIGEAEELWEGILADAGAGRLKPVYRAEKLPALEQAIVPAWDRMNLNIYARPWKHRMGIMPLFTTRGCPMGCRFCTVTQYFGKTYRSKTVEHVLEEVDKTGAREYFFVDDNIVCRPEYSRELFRALAPKRIRWFSQVSTTILKNPDLIDLAARSGCYSLFVGIESINKHSLAGVKKHFNNVEAYEELFARLRKAKIVAFPSIMFGFDGDTLEQFEETVEFLVRNKVSIAAFWILTPYPGTAVHEEMQKDGRIRQRDWTYYNGSQVVFEPKNFSEQQLTDHFWRSCADFYSPSRVARRIAGSFFEARHPLLHFLQTIFFQTQFRSNVLSRNHVFAGGFGHRA
ncbi:MAG: radical SAM protein [Verrucomicrobiae bacterium]|nr:radical SAM protein [Verrucomicrobiae bacterium]